jgi:Skp family chaperone for outer membrane proteins
MKLLLLACGTTLFASAAIAQAAPPAKPIPRSEYIKNVDNRFSTIDANHDGKITKEELAAEQQRELQQAKVRMAQQLEAKFKQLDTNKDGQLNLQEFMAAAPPLRTAETPEQMIAALDANHDGRISADEFRVPELAKFNKVDANHDGVVTPEEIRAAAGRK